MGFFKEQLSDDVGGEFQAILLGLALGVDVNLLIQLAYFGEKLKNNASALATDLTSAASFLFKKFSSSSNVLNPTTPLLRK